MSRVETTIPAQERQNNRGVEYEDIRPDGDGKPPRTAYEPKGAEKDVADQDKTLTDPSTGEPNDEEAR